MLFWTWYIHYQSLPSCFIVNIFPLNLVVLFAHATLFKTFFGHSVHTVCLIVLRWSLSLWHQHYWNWCVTDSLTRNAVLLAFRHTCNKLQLVTSKLFYHFWYSDHLHLVAKISRYQFYITKSRQPFEPLRFETVPRGVGFERLEEVEYYHFLHFWYIAYTCSISEMQNYNNYNIQPPNFPKKNFRKKVFWRN